MLRTAAAQATCCASIGGRLLPPRRCQMRLWCCRRVQGCTHAASLARRTGGLPWACRVSLASSVLTARKRASGVLASSSNSMVEGDAWDAVHSAHITRHVHAGCTPAGEQPPAGSGLPCKHRGTRISGARLRSPRKARLPQLRQSLLQRRSALRVKVKGAPF